MSDFKKLKVVELRAELSKRGLTQAGKRDELIERLEEYEFQHAAPSDTEVDSNSPVEADHEELQSVSVASKPNSAHVSPSPITAPLNIENGITCPVNIDLEEEKRRARAIRFGLNADEFAQVDIIITVKKLDHALPSRGGTWKHRKHQHKVVKN
jgi:hypothetical protein